jgi:hypothetical protein
VLLKIVRKEALFFFGVEFGEIKIYIIIFFHG